ncbi:MAG: hypothetical protein M3R23_08180 [Actinomycetota bacterium]|nr:hypothetical protein [Actinomycetota bacterium]
MTSAARPASRASALLDEFPDDVTFDNVQGLDNVAAIVDSKDVGGRYDGAPTRATLYYVGGAWKVFYVETQ